MILESLFKQRENIVQPMKTSPGKLKSYQQCPYKYRLIHIDERRVEQKPSPHLAMDAILNQMVEAVQKKLLKGSVEPVLDLLSEELNKAWHDDKFPDPDDRTLFRSSAAAAVQCMAQWFAESRGEILIHHNKPAIGMFAPWYPRPLTIWTRLDRVERLPDGTIRVIDFKSGAREMEPAALFMDLGIRIQAMAAREMFGQDVQSIALVFMRSGRTVEVNLDDLELDLLLADINSIVMNIQNKRFDPNLGPLCSVCEFQGECPGWRKKLPWIPVKETPEIFKNRLRLSYSKMSLYERCPRAYHVLYHQNIAPKPQPFFSFGSCIHAVMEDFYDPASRERPTREYMMEILDEKWRFFRIGYRSEEEEERYALKARAMLEMFFEHFVRNQKFKPAYFIEKYFELPVGDDAVMTGFIDRIDRLPKGGFIVLDYKTEPTDRTQESVDIDLQLTLYYWAAREFLGLDIRKLGLFMMSHDKLVVTTRTPDDVPKLFDRINDVTAQIRCDSTFSPKINKYCLSCDHLAGCPLESSIRSDPSLRSMEFNDEDLLDDALGEDA